MYTDYGHAYNKVDHSVIDMPYNYACLIYVNK